MRAGSKRAANDAKCMWKELHRKKTFHADYTFSCDKECEVVAPSSFRCRESSRREAGGTNRRCVVAKELCSFAQLHVMHGEYIFFVFFSYQPSIQSIHPSVHTSKPEVEILPLSPNVILSVISRAISDEPALSSEISPPQEHREGIQSRKLVDLSVCAVSSDSTGRTDTRRPSANKM